MRRRRSSDSRSPTPPAARSTSATSARLAKTGFRIFRGSKPSPIHRQHSPPPTRSEPFRSRFLIRPARKQANDWSVARSGFVADINSAKHEGAKEIPGCSIRVRSPDIWFDDWPGSHLCRAVALDRSKGRDSKSGDYSAFVMLAWALDDTLYVDADLDRRPR
jgi:hypothetical protein